MKTSFFLVLAVAVPLLALLVLTHEAAGQVTAPAMEGRIDARLLGSPDGSVIVRFRGVVGVEYRIEYTDSAPDDPAGWKVAAGNVVAVYGVGQ